MQNKILIIALTLATTACTPSREGPESPALNQAQVVDDNKLPDGPLPDLSILQLEGKWNTHLHTSIELKELRGEVLVLVMIYTSCKAACPRLVADMRAIAKKVSKTTTKGVRYVLVSIDPETDTATRLEAFAKENKMNDPKWLFLQGTKDSVLDFANVLAVKYKKISPMDFSHSNIISVFDSEGVLAHQQEGLSVNNAETVQTIIKLASKAK